MSFMLHFLHIFEDAIPEWKSDWIGGQGKGSEVTWPCRTPSLHRGKDVATRGVTLEPMARLRPSRGTMEGDVARAGTERSQLADPLLGRVRSPWKLVMSTKTATGRLDTSIARQGDPIQV